MDLITAKQQGTDFLRSGVIDFSFEFPRFFASAKHLNTIIVI
jgi:hypothetical protein